MEDLSDEVSALSMDGASTIGKNLAFTHRLQIKVSDVKRLGTIEDAAENDIDANGINVAAGEELIEPFPKTFEEWKEKKEMKKKQKHKSSKKSHKKSSRKKEKLREDSAEGPPIPITEIAIKAPAAPAAASEYNIAAPLSPARSSTSKSNVSRKSKTTHNSITSSTDSSTRRSSSILSGPGAGRIPNSPSKRSHPHRYSEMSESMKSESSQQSHVPIEKIIRIKRKLERATQDEQQVLEIHKQLEKEVADLEMDSYQYQQQRHQIHHELEIASSERYQLQRTLMQLQAENDKLRAKLRKAEDKEDKKRLDDVLDCMESKMKALKLHSQRSKERKRSAKI